LGRQILTRVTASAGFRVGCEWIRTYRQIAQLTWIFNREETHAVAALLALAGGYVDAYSWITHRVFANAQTANTLFLWINNGGRVGEGPVLPSVADCVCYRRDHGLLAPSPRWRRAAPISLLVEIIFLVVVAILHNIPGVAGTLGSLDRLAALRATRRFVCSLAKKSRRVA